jgi:hypothetical protein
MGQIFDSNRIKELVEERQKLTLEQKLVLMNELRNLEIKTSECAKDFQILKVKEQAMKKCQLKFRII